MKITPWPIDEEMPRNTTACMPSYEDIPKEFKSVSHPWAKWQSEWFFNGLKTTPTAKDGIDGKEALRHLSRIQRSFDTKHEHKQCAVAYLASMWFESPK